MSSPTAVPQMNDAKMDRRDGRNRSTIEVGDFGPPCDGFKWIPQLPPQPLSPPAAVLIPSCMYLEIAPLGKSVRLNEVTRVGP